MSEPNLAKLIEKWNEQSLTTEELRSLYKYLEKQYLPYDDLFLHATVRKLGKIIEAADKNDMAGQAS